MLASREYDDWSQKDHKDRDYKSEAEAKFFGAVENPKPAPQELRELYRAFSRYLEKKAD